MTVTRLQALRISLLVSGMLCMALGPLMLFWPSGWRWEPYHPHYEQMIVGLYFTLGVFLLFAAKEPLRHLSLIWFFICSSFVHAAIMTFQSASGPQHHGHLVADIPALFIAVVMLSILTPRRLVADPMTALV